jgi:uncharacterized protein (TIGR02300 family)
MPKKEWGVKRICPTTGRRFYDLNKTPIVSPYTGETVTLDANTRTRVAVVEKEKPAEETTESDDLGLLDDNDDESKDSSVSDELLDDEEETVSLDDIADVPADDKES